MPTTATAKGFVSDDPDAAPKILAEFIGLSWEGLAQDARPQGYPMWAFNDIGSLQYQGGKAGLRETAAAVAAASPVIKKRLGLLYWTQKATGWVSRGPSAYVVCCTNPMCASSSRVIFALKDDVQQQLVETWNRRPSPPAAAGVVTEIEAERRRQIEAKGWTAEHDDEMHPDGHLAFAAACYAAGRNDIQTPTRRPVWPWEAKWWKNSNRRRSLVKAGALIVAEIERLDRRALLSSHQAATGD